MNFKMSFREKGGTFGQALSSIKKQHLASKEVIKQFGEDTAMRMRNTIEKSRKRSKSGFSKLINSITSEFFDDGDTYGFGVGNIEKMDKEVVRPTPNPKGKSHYNEPYWRFVNYGGSFKENTVAVGYWEGDRFVIDDYRKDPRSKAYHFRKTVEPMNFVENTQQWVQRFMEKIGTILFRR